MLEHPETSKTTDPTLSRLDKQAGAVDNKESSSERIDNVDRVGSKIAASAELASIDTRSNKEYFTAKSSLDVASVAGSLIPNVTLTRDITGSVFKMPAAKSIAAVFAVGKLADTGVGRRRERAAVPGLEITDRTKADSQRDSGDRHGSDYWRDYWREYWRDYYRGSNNRSDTRYDDRRDRGYDDRRDRGSDNRRSLVPDGWDRYRPDNYDRNRGYDRNDRGRRDYSNYDENLPPEWRNGRWRESREDNRRDSRHDDRRNYRVPGDRRGNDARILPYRYGDDRILSEPTITVQKIEEVLRQYNSPAQGLGQLIFDLGVQYKINPAMALAFFVKESSAGTKGWAVKTNNWGNRKGTGPAGRAGPFMKYHSFEDSVKDWYPYIIRRYVNQGLDTLPTLIHTYAPNNDGNNEAGYVRAVMNMMRKWSV